MISLIAAVAKNGVIGRAGALPWNLSSDLQHFKSLTLGKTIIMGRKTFESLPCVLPNRKHVVISRDREYAYEGIVCVGSLDEAVRLIPDEQDGFVIGGSAIYALALPICQRLYITEILSDVTGDVYFPEFDRSLYSHISSSEVYSENGISYLFAVYERKG